MYSIESSSQTVFKIKSSYRRARSVKERLSAKLVNTKGFGVKARKLKK
jgi:hypothetical protein